MGSWNLKWVSLAGLGLGLVVACGSSTDGSGESDSQDPSQSGGSSDGSGDGSAASGDGDSDSQQSVFGDSADGSAGSGGGSADGSGSGGGSGSGSGSGNGSQGGSGDQGSANGAGDMPAELDPDVDWEAFQIAYTPMYSAYDGVHTFALPAYADEVATEVEDWQAIPQDAVSFAPWQSDDGSQVGVLITVEQPVPEVTIAVRNGALGGKTTLHITETTPETWDIGEERYMSGASFDIEAMMMDPEAAAMFAMIFSMIEWVDGMPVFTGTAADLGFDTFLRCDSCHSSGAENFQVEHTPTQIAQFSDEELIRIFTMGMKPPGAEFRALDESMQSFYEFMHTWDVDDEQAAGLVVYLRSLTPKGQGEILAPAGGPPFGTNPDYSKLPASCNPMGGMFDFLLCQLELPPVCRPDDPAFDMAMCEAMFSP